MLCALVKQRVGGYKNPNCHNIPSLIVTYLLLYIDDILIVGSNSEYVHHLKPHFSSKFQIFDLGNLSYFLGLTFRIIPVVLLNLLHSFQIFEVKSCLTPMPITTVDRPDILSIVDRVS